MVLLTACKIVCELKKKGAIALALLHQSKKVMGLNPWPAFLFGVYMSSTCY